MHIGDTLHKCQSINGPFDGTPMTLETSIQEWTLFGEWAENTEETHCQG